MPRLNVDVEREIYDEFKSNCESEDRSISSILRVFIIGWNSDKRVERELKKRSLGANRPEDVG